MAKRDNKDSKFKKEQVPLAAYLSNARVHDVPMGEYNKKGMKIFAINVQLARAIPDVIDGFEPVQRRCLYAVAKIGKAEYKMKKVKGLVGDIIQIHPHGDSSPEDVLTDMSKEWEMNYPLITIEGNNGNASGDEAAAGRYLDACLSEYARDCYFKEWSDDIVEMNQSYNPEYKEPEYMISRYPDVLLRANIGFCYGQATNIPSFNLEEAFNAVIQLIKDPDYEPILYPDMPCECQILDEGQFPEMCRTGRGPFKMRAEILIDEKNHSLIIKSIPYKGVMESIKQKIYKLHKEGELPTLKNLYDDSTVFHVDTTLVFEPGTDLVTCRNILYRKTGLEKTFATAMIFVVSGELRLLNLKQVMEIWINNRRNIKRKYYIGKFVWAQERISILKILIDIIEHPKLRDKIIDLISHTEDGAIVEMIHKKYDISTLQANGFANLKIRELSPTALAKYKVELKALEDDVKELKSILEKPKKIDKIIISELEKGIEKYSKPRRCTIVKYNKEEDDTSLVTNKEYILVFTKMGLVKKLPLNTKSIEPLNEGDDPLTTLKINNRDNVVIFDSGGMIHTIKVADIQESDKQSKGIMVSRYVHIKGEIVSVFEHSKLNGGYFLFATKGGMVKRTNLNKYTMRTSVVAILTKNKDKLVSVVYIKNRADVILYTRNGYGVRFDGKDINETSRMSSGVIGIDLTEGDEVIGLTVVGKKDDRMFILTDKGYGKVCMLDSFQQGKRRDTGLPLIKLLLDDHLNYVGPSEELSKFMIVLKNDQVTMSADEIPILTRTHSGRKLVGVRKGELIIKCLRLI